MPIGHAVNPNIAMVTGFSVPSRTRGGAPPRRSTASASSGYALGHHYVFGEHKPGPHRHLGQVSRRRGTRCRPSRRRSAASARRTQLRTHLRSFEESGVDQVVFIQQGGRNKHEHICEALELFASDVMPEFKAREIERAKQKAAKNSRPISRRRWRASRR